MKKEETPVTQTTEVPPVTEPTNETKEGRKINRRIELILSPNLDDLYDILEE